MLFSGLCCRALFFFLPPFFFKRLFFAIHCHYRDACFASYNMSYNGMPPYAMHTVYVDYYAALIHTFILYKTRQVRRPPPSDRAALSTRQVMPLLVELLTLSRQRASVYYYLPVARRDAALYPLLMLLNTACRAAKEAYSIHGRSSEKSSFHCLLLLTWFACCRRHFHVYYASQASSSACRHLCSCLIQSVSLLFISPLFFIFAFSKIHALFVFFFSLQSRLLSS